MSRKMKKGRFRAIVAALLCATIVASTAATTVVMAAEVDTTNTLSMDVNEPFHSEAKFDTPDEKDVTSKSYRIPSMVTLADGTIVAAADIRWNTTYDGGGLDTLVARSTDGGVSWNYTAANYLGDNGNEYNGKSSTTFIDPSLTVAADGQTVYMLCDLYAYGLALNGEKLDTPSTKVGFTSDGYLKLTDDGHKSYSYYLKDGKIYKTSGNKEVTDYTVDGYFNLYDAAGTKVSNLFYEDSPYKVANTGYLYLTKSEDGGASWSAPTLLNLKTSSEQVCLVGPGRGITTSNGTMVFPVYSYNGNNPQQLGFVYSVEDSNGNITWHRSENFTGAAWSSESAVVEIGNTGNLRFFYRNGTGNLCYADYNMSEKKWGSAVNTGVKTNSNTQLSAITYSKTVGGKQVVLVSCPTGPDAEGSTNNNGVERLNGRIFAGVVNADGTMTWGENPINVSGAVRGKTNDDAQFTEEDEGFFAYSCLTEREDGSVAILYENEQHGWGANDPTSTNPTYFTMNMKAYDASDLGLTFDGSSGGNEGGGSEETGTSIQGSLVVGDKTYNVTATGKNIPADAVLSVAAISAPTDPSFQIGFGDYECCLDISIIDTAGNPVENLGPVTITLPSEAVNLQPGKTFAVVHNSDADTLYDEPDELLGPYTTTSGQDGESTATFTTSSLSPFYIAEVDGLVDVNKKGRFKDEINLYSSYSGSGTALLNEETVNSLGDGIPGEFTILYAVKNSKGEVWYWLDTDNWPEAYYPYRHYRFVKESDLLVEGVLTGTFIDHKGNPREVNVYGDFSFDVSMDLKSTDNNYGYGEANAYFDLSLMKNGAVWQPGAEDKSVLVSVDTDLEDGTLVYVYHKHGHELDTLGGMEHVVMNGRVTFEVDEFSVFVVTEAGNRTGTEIGQGNVTANMIVGDAQKGKMVFYSSSAGTNGTSTWKVADPDGAISYNVIGTTNATGKATHAPWIEVTALTAGTATLTFTYNNNQTETLTIHVAEATEKFHIANRVSENGCLVATWPNGVAPADATYKWTRKLATQTESERTEPCAESLSANKDSVNISVDHGGLTNATIDNPYTYTVTATGTVNGKTVTYTDSYTVTYGSELLNPSFEFPLYATPENASLDYVSIPNGTPGLFWQTTAPGKGDKLTQDVEITVHGEKYYNGGTNNDYRIRLNAAEGSQFAEVNAEEFGTLYQDMLTTPGATLTWQFNHAGRRNAGGTANNTLYVVLAATESAQKVIGKTEISAMLDAAGDLSNIPSTGAGREFTYDGTKYVIWKHDASNPRETWSEISGYYKVPEGQYLTRFFFASDPDAGGNQVLGNLIDNVRAKEEMKYRVEYYHNGQLLSGYTESDMVNVHDDVKVENLDDILALPKYSGSVITEVTMNKYAYSGSLEHLHITSYPKDKNDTDPDPIVLRIYLKDSAIVVNKVVKISDWDKLSEKDRQKLINGYDATFELYKGDTATGTPVGTATVTIQSVTGKEEEISARCEFTGVSLESAKYTIKETTADPLTDYILKDNDFARIDVGADGEFVTTPMEDNTTLYAETVTVDLSQKTTAEVICTNEYQKSTGSLTITKTVPDGDYENGDTFIFNVTGPNNFKLTVTISGQDIKNGKNSVIINNLPLGEYTVTEDTDWSWRYTVDGKAQKNATISATTLNQEVQFKNEKTDDQWLDYNTFADNIFDAVTTNNGNTSSNG